MIYVPGGAWVYAEGWPEEEGPWTLDGDLNGVLEALHLTGEQLEEADVEVSARPQLTEWTGLGRLILGHREPWARAELATSVFKVLRTEEYTSHLQEQWFPNL